MGLHIQFITTRVTEAANGRWVEGNGQAIRLLHADTEHLAYDLVCCRGTFIPVLQTHEHSGRTSFVTAADQIETINDKLGTYRIILGNGRAYSFHGLGGTAQSCSIRHDDGGDDIPLVFR